jgi:hypothetical protein
MIHEIRQAQADMRFAYNSGATGMLASAIAWTCATATVLFGTPGQAVWTLFIGGMLIHPVSILISKMLGRPGNHSKGNPLGALALASTAWLIFSLPLAYAASLLRIEWFFPAMLLVIGGRYLVFAALYGMRTYWVCGLTLAGAGFLLGLLLAPPILSAFAGAAIELTFAAALFVLDQRAQRASTLPEQNATLGPAG